MKTKTEKLKEKMIRVDGLGIVIKKLDRLVKLQEKLTNAVFHLENKVEALMDESAQARHESIIQRFKKD